MRRILRRDNFPAEVSQAADGLALASAALWFLHPIQAEVIGYVTQRTESLMGLFCLLALYASIRTSEHGANTSGWTVVAIVACLLGMTTKESMVTAPIAILLVDSVFIAGTPRRALADRRWLYTGLAASWVLLVALNVGGPRFRSAGFQSGTSPWAYLLNQDDVIVQYLRVTFFPSGMIRDYGPTLPTSLAAVWPQALLVVSLLAATALAWTKWPSIALLGTWVWLTLAPTSSIVPIATEVGADRRMYLPLAAIATMVVVVGYLALLRVGIKRTAYPIGAVVAVCAVFALLSYQDTALYRDPVRLWQSVVDVRPHGRAHYNLGNELKNAGRRDDALTHFRRAAELEEPEAFYALGYDFEQNWQYDEAITNYQTFLRLAPDDYHAPRTTLRLGITYAAAGRVQEAEAAFKRVIEMRPSDGDAWISLADLLLHAERLTEAEEAYRRHLALVPGNPAAHHNLGLAFVGMHREPEAVVAFETAVKLSPDNPGFRLSYGNALSATGRTEEAVRQYRAGIVMAPDDPRLRFPLGLALANLGRFEEALEELRRAAQMAPDDPEIRETYERLDKLVD